MGELISDKFIDDHLVDYYRNNLYEYEQGTSVPIVKGRLRAHLRFWIQLGASHWVLNIIKHGYFIPFLSMPPSVVLPNNKSARVNSAFVSEAVSTLLAQA